MRPFGRDKFKKQDGDVDGDDDKKKRNTDWGHLLQKKHQSQLDLEAQQQDSFRTENNDSDETRQQQQQDLLKTPFTPSSPTPTFVSNAGGDGLVKMNPMFDQMMVTIDDEHESFDPNQHWVSCWGRFWYELHPCQNWFLVEDPPFTYRTLDVPASFSPNGPIPVSSKSTAMLTCVGILGWSIFVENHKGFFFAYLSTWNMIFAIIYHYFSIYNSMSGAPQPYSRANGSVRLAWFFFVLTAHSCILENVLYWMTEYTNEYSSRNNSEEVDSEVNDTVGKFNFRIYMIHGGITLGVVMDGFQVNNIPLRWMHWWGCCLPVTILYAGWTLIHAYFVWGGNPNEPDRNSIYELIDWRSDFQQTPGRVCIVAFVISPMVFLVLWMMSLYKWFCCWCACCRFRKTWKQLERRRYLEETQNMGKYRAMVAKQQLEGQEQQEETTDDDPNNTAFHADAEHQKEGRKPQIPFFSSPTSLADSSMSELESPTSGNRRGKVL